MKTTSDDIETILTKPYARRILCVCGACQALFYHTLIRDRGSLAIERDRHSTLNCFSNGIAQ